MPRFLKSAIARLRGVLHRDVITDEIRDELQFHIDMRTAEYERNGDEAAAARRRAASRVGNLAVHQDRGYDIRGGGFIETVLQDVRYTVRLWRRQPGFAIAAIVTLALGIGISTALFSVIDAALLRPLPFPHPEQLVGVDIEAKQRDGSPYFVRSSLLDARDWRAASRSVSAVAVMRAPAGSAVMDAGAGPEHVAVGELSEGSLDLYERPPVLGRGPTAADVAVDAPRVVLLGYGYWQRRFAGSADVLGRTVRFVGDEPATVIGVMAPDFYSRTELWRPPHVEPRLGLSMRGMGTDTYARLRPGVALADAERELTNLTRQIAGERGTSPDIRVRLTPLHDETTGGYSSTISILSAAVGGILLIACINVAGLLLARGTARHGELAVRAAIGAGRGRLVRQLLTESAVLALAGALVGTLLAWVSLDLLVSIIPLQLPATSSATLNMTVLAFTLVLSIVTAVLVGVAPARKLSRPSLSPAISGRRGLNADLSRRSGQILICIEVALAIVLLSGAGLMVRSLARMLAVDVGFDPSTVLTMEVVPFEQTPEIVSQYYPALVEAIRAVPGVAAVSAIDNFPMSNSMSISSAQAQGGPRVNAIMRRPLAGYFETIGQTIRQGRVPTAAEIESSGPLAAINEAAAAKLFAGGQAIGRTLNIPPRGMHEVVAVVANGGARPEVWTFSHQPITRPMQIVIRPLAGARVSDQRLREAATTIGPRVFVDRIRSGSAWRSDSIATPRHRTLLFALLGGLGLLLTLVGIFGTTAYAVARRTREIGVRMAFGARPGQVVRTMVADATWPILIGTALGLGGAMLSTKVIAKFLFQTTPTDPMTFATVAIGLGIAGGLAAWWPARRAAKVDPVAALSSE